MTDTPALLEQANNELQAGRLADAEATARKVLQAAPDTPSAWHIAGLAVLRQGRAVEAVRNLARATELDERNAMLWMHLGIAQGMAGDLTSSIESLRESIVRNPDLVTAYLNLGLTLTNAGRLSEAESVYRDAVARTPTHAGALEGLGNTLLALDRPSDAIDAFERALKSAPNAPLAWGNLGIALMETGEPTAAADAMEHAIALDPKNPELHLNLGNALLQAGHIDNAIQQLSQAVALRPGWPVALGSLASAYEKSGQLELARETAEQTLTLVPQNARAQLVLAELALRKGDIDEARDTLSTLADAVVGKTTESTVLNRFAQALDRSGEYDRAFANFKRAQDIAATKPTARGIDRSRFPARISRNKSGFDDASDWPRTFDDGIRAPIFLIGFPRSGTTLLERMLDAHPNLICSDERDWLDRVLVNTMTAPRPEAVGRLSDTDVERMRAEYLSIAHDDLGEESVGKRVVDKNPLNMVQLGYIRRIFPDSPILFAERDPRDVVLSCYFQLFRPNMAMVHFLTLEDTADLYCQVMDLWLAQRDRLGANVFSYKYEDLIDDVEGMARKIIDFAGEPWDEALLQYAEKSQRRFITTPSRADVTGAIHRRGVARWRHYEKALAPVLPSLQRFVDAFGYAR